MTTQLYRMYSGDQAEYNYRFSVLASDNEVKYVVPSDDVELGSVFNQDRIKELIIRSEEGSIPTDPEGWALLATYNAGFGMNLYPVGAPVDEDIDLIIEDEQEYANETAAKYAYMRENQ